MKPTTTPVAKTAEAPKLAKEIFLSAEDKAAYIEAMDRIDKARLAMERAQSSAQFLAGKLLRKYAGGKPAQIHPETGEVYILPADGAA